MTTSLLLLRPRLNKQVALLSSLSCHSSSATSSRSRHHHHHHHDPQQRRSHYSYHGPGSYQTTDEALHALWKSRDFVHRGFTVGIGGPVGSGKTATVWKLCQAWQEQQQQQAQPNDNATNASSSSPMIGVVTNDIFTAEDAQFLTRQQALPADRIRAVETGGCPHAAIREDVSANLTALEELTAHLLLTKKKQGEQDKTASTTTTTTHAGAAVPPLLLCESGGDNLAANFSRELADLTIYVIDVAGGDKVPRKGGPGITQSDLFVVNKVDLAEAVGADLDVMRRDANAMRGAHAPTLFCSVKHGQGVPEIQDFIMRHYTWAMEHCLPPGQEQVV